MRRYILLAVCCLFLLASGCSVNKQRYASFMAHMPKSILILPPKNATPDIRATEVYLSTVTLPLAECGYYVLPIAVVDRMLKENGVPTPGEMHQVPLRKLGDVFGADAVLYITIEEWGTQYLVLGSNTTVQAEYQLVDVSTGTPLWSHQQKIVKNSGDSGAGIAGALVGAAVHALSSVATEGEREVAITANETAFSKQGYRLPKGWRHPDFQDDQERFGGAE